MRQKRAKAYKKQMNIYLHTFKFREPFQTIVDDELVLTCDKASFDLAKGLDRTIQGETKPMITQCCMQALYATDNQSAIELAKKFERRRCNHPPKDPKPPVECIRSIVDIDGVNKHRYIVATQSTKLRRKLRSVPGVPMVFMNRSVMVMEPVSDASRRTAALSENAKLSAGLNDAKVGYVDKEEEKTSDQPKKKRKGPAAPNPLSIKKKKTENVDLQKPQGEKKKRVRKHKTSGTNGAESNGAENNGTESNATESNGPENSETAEKAEAAQEPESKETKADAED